MTNLQAIVLRLAHIPHVHDDRLQLASFIQRILRFYQFWPRGVETTAQRILGWSIYAISNLIIFTSLAHAIKYATETEHFEYDAVSIDLPVVFASPAGLLLFNTMYSQIGGWQTLLVELGDFRIFEKPAGIEEHDALLEALLKVSLMMIFVPVPFVTAFFATKHCPDERDYSCGFVFPAYFPGCLTQPNRRFCSILIVGSACLVASIAFITSALFCQVSEYFVIYLQHLRTLLQRIPHIPNIHARRAHVLRVLRYHNRILDLYDHFYSLVKQAYLYHIFVTPVVLAMLVFTFLTHFAVQNLTTSFLFIFSLFFVCIIGQRLITANEQLIIVAYESIPLDGDLATVRDLRLLMLRTQRLLHVPAGSLMYCGYELCAQVLKTTYSYLTLIRSTGGLD